MVCEIFCDTDSSASYEPEDVTRIAAPVQGRCVPPLLTKEKEASVVLFVLFWCIVPQLTPTPPPLKERLRREANVEPSFAKVQRPKVADASTGPSNGETSGGRKCMQY